MLLRYENHKTQTKLQNVVIKQKGHRQMDIY